MHRLLIVPLAILAGVALLLSPSATNAVESRPNVLFIAVDDLRPELACYGAEHIRSPNIDRLASSGLRFDCAYCQQAVCNPSRTSLMTGLRPDTIGVTSNHSHFRSKRPDVVTLPQHFKRHGYHAAAIGKLYHGVFPDGASNTPWDTMGDPQSWSVPAIRFGPRYYYTEDGVAAAKETFARAYKSKTPEPDDWTQKLVFGPATEAPHVEDNVLYDGKVADAAVTALRELKQKPEQPFFLAVGFIKPHSPYIAPKKYFDLYDDVDIATKTTLPDGAPGFAGHNSGELRRYTDQPKRGEIGAGNQRRVRHAYYACVSFIDAQVGRVLDELDRLGLSDNTIVSLYGDHGYHLGEQGLWGKTTNFELDTRVPLIIRAPGMKAPGKSSSSLVELVDLYPTLANLAGLPVGNHLEGTSLSPLLDDPQQSVKEAAFSQYPRGGMMGYSMRTPTHRLTLWVDRRSGEVKATELYDYADGPMELKNVADDEKSRVGKLTAQLAAISPALNGEQPPVVKASPPVEFNAATATATSGTSFEQQKAGDFKTLETKLGKWTTSTGAAIIDNKHATTGRQCLQLAGGKETIVELELADGINTRGNLSFRAERWTKRNPFSFRIEKRTGDKWAEIYNGDNAIRVGRPFLTDVDVVLGDPNIDRLRFTVVSPPNTGILIDDLRIAPPRPQQITTIEVVPLALPALVGADHCPLLKVKIETVGRLNPISITKLRASLDGVTDLRDIATVQGFADSSSGNFTANTTFGAASKPAEQVTFSGKQVLAEGTNYVWVACKLKDSANIDHRVGAVCESLEFSNGKSVDLQSTPSIQSMGVRVRDGGDDDVHTYRIPGLATTKKGTLIAAYDVRHRSGGDLPGDIDVGMSRSTDGGRTWERMKIIMDMGDDPDFRYDGIGDPTVLVDTTTGTVWCGATWSHGNRSWVGSQPGLEPEDTGQFMLVNSDDDGVTWSKPINITQQVKKPEWSFLLQGPGKGITMSDGALVMPAQYQDPPNANDKWANRLPHSAFIFSRDHGKTWDISTGAYDDTTEAQVVELADGQIMINCRYNRESKRVVRTTTDLGKTWQDHPTNRQALIEPGACMASLINVGRELRQLGVENEYAKRNDFLLFSNPDSLRGRNHITIKASLDGGNTWPQEHHLLLDEGDGRGYSCMTMIDAETVGIIYEGSQAHLAFQRVKLADILNPPSDQKTKNPAKASNKTVAAASPFTTEEQITDGEPVAADVRPNILFIVSEDNSEHLGCYGERRVHTPHLDSLAEGGVRYTRAYVPYSVCSPSRSAFLTGLYTRQTGHIGLATHRFSMYRDFKTMPARFREAGYYTGFLGKTHINPERLVEDHVDHRAIRVANFGKTISIESYAEAAGAVIQQAADRAKPFLLIINYADAHRKFVRKSKHGFPTRLVDGDIEPFPWIGSDSPHLREELRDYFNCMNRLDEGVGMVLKKLDEAGVRDNTLIVYISDHGADFPRGKGSIYENGSRVPMIVNYPKSFPKGRVENGMVSTIDILPTMLRAARLPVPEHLPGFALQDINSGKVPPRKYIHTFTTGSAPSLLYMQFGIRDERYKLVYNPDRTINRLAESRYKNSNLPADQHVQSFLYPPEYELFDLQEDPHEWKNLADSAQYQNTRQRLLKAMQDFQRTIKDPFVRKENIATFIAEQKEHVHKPYKQAGFRWPHLKMFEAAHEAVDAKASP